MNILTQLRFLVKITRVFHVFPIKFRPCPRAASRRPASPSPGEPDRHRCRASDQVEPPTEITRVLWGFVVFFLCFCQDFCFFLVFFQDLCFFLGDFSGFLFFFGDFSGFSKIFREKKGPLGAYALKFRPEK